MRTLKSRREIARMEAAGRLVADAHRLVRSLIEPGLPTIELDRAVERLFASAGAVPLFKGVPGKVPFPAVVCVSIDEEVVHGIPGPRRLKAGEIVSIDTGCRLDGWCGDAAWTYPVGEVDPLRRRLLDVGRRTLQTAIAEFGRRKNWSEVAAAIEGVVHPEGLSLVEKFVGHGIGREMHEDPQVPNFVCRDRERKLPDFSLEPGLVLAIEPMVSAGTKECVVDPKDHWTVRTKDGRPSVHFEHTVALTSEGPLILTAGVGE